ncbi:hypothetical protein ACI7RC_18195 [Brevibacillus sp. B_LB10_24]|uniref:hypothetical protein n=1 Tax=Brevibacillus sp. B_LB10_24 TaxID=3380645 RepID=UPI0038B9C5C5
MQLRIKSLTGIVQPLSYVDLMLRRQGFRRTGEDHPPTYDVVLYDSATSTSYFLCIPTNLAQCNLGQGEPSVKIGHPYLETRIPAQGQRAVDHFVIPREVQQAAEHKLSEIADYLCAPPH